MTEIERRHKKEARELIKKIHAYTLYSNGRIAAAIEVKPTQFSAMIRRGGIVPDKVLNSLKDLERTYRESNDEVIRQRVAEYEMKKTVKPVPASEPEIKTAQEEPSLIRTYNIKRADLQSALDNTTNAKDGRLYRLSEDNKRFILSYHRTGSGEIRVNGWEIATGRRYALATEKALTAIPTLGYMTYEEVLRHYPLYAEY